MKNKILIPILMAVTFVFITITGIEFKQSLFLRIPLYVSLVIALLQSRVNRYASLLGGINSVIYAAVYVHYHLYASAAYALLLSFPLQIITFIMWSRKPWENSTVLKKLSGKMRIIIAAATIVAWCVICFVLTGTDAKFRELDTAVTVLGIAATILTMLSYYEYTFVMLAGGICTIVLYILMLKDTPEQITYLGFSVYSLICTILAFGQVHIIYKKQRKDVLL